MRNEYVSGRLRTAPGQSLISAPFTVTAGTSTPDTTHPTAACAQEDVGLLGRGMQFLGLKKKPQTDEEEVPSWHPAQYPMTEPESQSFRRRLASGETLSSRDQPCAPPGRSWPEQAVVPASAH